MSWRAQDLLWFLTLMPLAAAVLVLGWHLRRRALRRFGDPSTVETLIAGRSAGWRAARGLLFVLGLGLLIVALAGPQYGSRTRTLRKRGLDAVVALDFSKSMLAQDVHPSRIDRAKAEIARLLEELQGSRVGAVAFAGDTIQFPMTVDHGALRLFMQDLAPYDMPVGGTAIAKALVASKRLLEHSRETERPADPEMRPDQVVVLITDGEDHRGDPVEAARELADAGVRVYAIGIGSPKGEPIPTYAPDGTRTGYLRDEDGRAITTSLSPENEATLREVARATGGEYLRAEQGTVGIDQLRVELAKLEQAEQEARRVTVHEPRYALVLLPAFLFLLLESILPEAWIGRRRRRRV
ncbi:MAG: VWA domain-containing protein [Myxococcota bacterium]